SKVQSVHPQRSAHVVQSHADRGFVASPIHNLQRAFGNRSMNLLLHSRIIQPKLVVGQPDDLCEREADRVADQIMRMAGPTSDLTLRHIQPTIQRICTGCEDEVRRQSSMTLRRSPAQISRKCAKCEEKAALPSNELKEKNVPVRAKRESVNPSEASSDLRSYLAR